MLLVDNKIVARRDVNGSDASDEATDGNGEAMPLAGSPSNKAARACVRERASERLQVIIADMSECEDLVQRW